MGCGGAPHDVTGTRFRRVLGHGRFPGCTGPWSLRGWRECAPHDARGADGGGLPLAVRRRRDTVPWSLCSRSPRSSGPQPLGSCREAAPREGTKEDFGLSLELPANQVLLQGGFKRVVANCATRTEGDVGGHGLKLWKGMTPDTGESCPQDLGHGRVLEGAVWGLARNATPERETLLEHSGVRRQRPRRQRSRTKLRRAGWTPEGGGTNGHPPAGRATSELAGDRPKDTAGIDPKKPDRPPLPFDLDLDDGVSKVSLWRSPTACRRSVGQVALELVGGRGYGGAPPLAHVW